MKGFIKVLESVIASIMLISAMTFFFSFQKPPDARRLQFDYVLPALQKNGTLNASVLNNDADTLNAALKAALPSTVDFSVEVSGIPNPAIKVLCACTDAQQSTIAARMSPLTFVYKKRTIEIRISNGDYGADGDLQKLVESNPDADVLLFYGYQSLAPEKSLLQNFLENGTVFMLSDLYQTQAEDGVMDDLFGLSWDETLSSSPSGDFADRENMRKTSYRIFRYYTELGGDRTDNFAVFAATVGKNQIRLDENTIVGYPLGNPQEMTGSLVKINRAGSRGRTVWFADYDSAGAEGAKINRLLKGAILWASGERFGMDPRFKIVPSSYDFSQHSYVDVLDNSEPFLITLKIWNVFY